MVFIGLISYPLYLWHYPLLCIGNILESKWVLKPEIIVATVTVTFILAFLTYKYVELPLRSSSSLKTTVSGLCASIAVLGIIGYITAIGGIRPRAGSYWQVGLMHSQTTTTDTWHVADPRGLLSVGNGRRIALFIGDNNMQQYYPRVYKIIADYPYNTYRAVFSVMEWCAPAAIELIDVGVTERFRAACKASLQRAVEYANNPKVDTVVIAACWYFYFMKFSDFDDFGDAVPLKPGTDGALGALTHMIKDFVVAGKRVYIILNIPVGASFDPHLIIRRSVLPPGFTVNTNPLDRDEIEKGLRPIESKLVKIAQDTGATVIDPKNSICNKATCPVVSTRGDFMYNDAWNLNPSYVQSDATFIDETLMESRASVSAPLPPEG